MALALTLGIFADSIPALQRLMILFFMILTLHEFEEYVYPGGFPAANNIGLMGETKDYGKYPLNELSAFIVNVVLAYPLYICGIIFYECLWLGIFIAYFTMLQFIIHCIVINRKLHSWFSPGCASALFVMLPFGIYYLTYIAGHFTFPGFYWWAPITAFPIVAVLMILSPILIVRKRNTKYGFAEYEATHFSVRKGIARFILQSLIIGLTTLAAYMIGSRTSLDVARTMTFATMVFSQFTIIFSIRSGHNWFTHKIFTNRWLWLTIIFMTALTLIVLLVPGMQSLFKLAPMTSGQWWTVIGLSFGVLALSELFKLFTRKANQA